MLKKLIAACMAAALFGLAPCTVFAQDYPVKPIRILVGYTAGGGADVAARLAAQKLQEALHQSIIVENRPGASGSIAIEAVSRAAPDGYTLLLMTSAGVAQAALAVKQPYDVQRDFAPAAMLITGPYVLVVRPSLAAKNVHELVALAKAAPGKLNYGSSGIGGQAHFAGELFDALAGTKMTHVPYKGAADFVAATVAGQIDLSFPSVASAVPLLGSGKLRALAVTSLARTALLPDVPTLEELGLKGYDLAVWYGLLAPRGTPAPVVRRINEVINKSFGAAEMKAQLARQGSEVRLMSPEQFATLIQKEYAQNVQLIKAAGIKPE